jgi:TPR repeat protein
MHITSRQLYLFMAVLLAFMIGIHCENRSKSQELEYAKAAYEKGDYAQPFETFQRLAKEGDAEGQFYLADLYYRKRNFTEAAEWYRKAADQEHLLAQFNLGSLYMVGLGVEQDFVEAAKWYRKAAEQGDGEAQNNLGLMYFKGEGVEQDSVQAYMWLIIAVESGFEQAYRARESLAAQLSIEQRAEGRRLSRAWRLKRR